MTEALALICMAALSGAAFLFHERDRQAWNKERAKLLDRIQSRSLSEFKALTSVTSTSGVTYLSDADEASLAEAAG